MPGIAFYDYIENREKMWEQVIPSFIFSKN